VRWIRLLENESDLSRRLVGRPLSVNRRNLHSTRDGITFGYRIRRLFGARLSPLKPKAHDEAFFTLKGGDFRWRQT
jgi:hypothetical protein